MNLVIPFPKKRVPKNLAQKELAILERHYPDARTALQYKSPFELIAAVILSAQCTDERVNGITPAFFKKYPTPQKLAKARQPDVEKIIVTCGKFRRKSQQLISMANALVEKFGGEVPRTRDELEALDGVGPKTASVVLAEAFNEPAIAVDTHVFRVSHRMGLTLGKKPVDVEHDLAELIPRKKWADMTFVLLTHGREICKAAIPRCDVCPVQQLCPTAPVVKALSRR